MDIRQTMRYLGAPIGAKSFLFGSNRSVVTSATLPHSTLTKRHNILAFHRIREAIAAKLMCFCWIQSAYNLSVMLSKHWDHPNVYPLILKSLTTRGNITLIVGSHQVPFPMCTLETLQKYCSKGSLLLTFC